MIRITLKHCTLEWTEEGCVTCFKDGTEIGAYPHDTPHYHVISHRLGYGDDILAYCREHEFAHSFVAEKFADAPSPILWLLAHGKNPPKKWHPFEEMAAQQFQRWLRANERPIVGGVDWDGMKAEALTLLE